MGCGSSSQQSSVAPEPTETAIVPSAAVKADSTQQPTTITVAPVAPAQTQPAPAPEPASTPAAASANPPAPSSTVVSSTVTAPVEEEEEDMFRPRIPVSVLTDSYKASHFLMYPESQLMVAYGEFRNAFNKDPEDSRFIFYGIRYIIENFVAVRWTRKDVEQADLFYKTHNVGYTAFPFPKDLFLQFVEQNDGYFPVRIEALPEGTVANVHVPVYQIFAEKQWSRLITFLETILTQVWYPSTVATLSRRTKDLVEHAFDTSVDSSAAFLADSRLHDFGFRGCTCVEQSILGGIAHLLNFNGSDTMSAAYYAQFYLNNGKPVATSIPATEHSVMTSWATERQAIENMIDKFGGEGNVFACVMDSYDYHNALTKVLPSCKDRLVKKGGLMVLRPDSGDPVDCVIAALEAGEKTFGCTINSKGYKVVKNVNVIQGDGININTVRQILDACLAKKYSAQNVAFGMGGGLLQRVNRDTMGFATKLSFIVYADGTQREIMKRPKTDSAKISYPGILKVQREGGTLWVHPRGAEEPHDPATNELKVVYDHRPIPGVWDTFDVIQQRVKTQWPQTPKKHHPTSQPLQARIDAWIKNFNENYQKMLDSI